MKTKKKLKLKQKLIKEQTQYETTIRNLSTEDKDLTIKRLQKKIS